MRACVRKVPSRSAFASLRPLSAQPVRLCEPASVKCPGALRRFGSTIVVPATVRDKRKSALKSNRRQEARGVAKVWFVVPATVRDKRKSALKSNRRREARGVAKGWFVVPAGLVRGRCEGLAGCSARRFADALHARPPETKGTVSRRRIAPGCCGDVYTARPQPREPSVETPRAARASPRAPSAAREARTRASCAHSGLWANSPGLRPVKPTHLICRLRPVKPTDGLPCEIHGVENSPLGDPVDFPHAGGLPPRGWDGLPCETEAFLGFAQQTRHDLGLRPVNRRDLGLRPANPTRFRASPSKTDAI